MGKKIYCILIDAMPFSKDILSFAKQKKLTILRQIGTCSTQFSCIEMTTGKMLSDLKKYGIGYYSKRKYRKKKGEWKWEEDLISTKFLRHGWVVRYHNGRLFRIFLSNKIKIKVKNSYKKHQNNYLCLAGEMGDKIHKRMKNYIEYVQKKNIEKNIMYFVYYEYFHESLHNYGKDKYESSVRISKERINSLMDCWNFDEPNSIFWVFADHGNWNLQPDMRHPEPQMYYSWALVKDNTENPMKINSKFISIRDFFPTIMNKMNYNFEPFLDIYNKKIIDISSIENIQNKNRIYYMEDARKKINKYGSTTALACKFVDWEFEKPRGILQVSYHLPDNEWNSKYTRLNENTLILKTSNIENVDCDLKQNVINRFKWVENNNF